MFINYCFVGSLKTSTDKPNIDAITNPKIIQPAPTLVVNKDTTKQTTHTKMGNKKIKYKFFICSFSLKFNKTTP